MQIIQRIKNYLVYPAAYAYMASQSMLNRFKGMGKKDCIVFENTYRGEPILLMALFEKGELRPDVVSFLLEARRQGIYVVCVNTLKVINPQRYESVVDCYIERYNFGRDFGSYKSGFLYLYQSGLAAQCPRMMLVNDSVFFSARNNEAFISEMFSSPVEALGATENYEIEHHLGSFCIALSGNVLNNEKLKKYWKSYACTDVRPVVIETGEMALSKLLRRLVSTPDNFRALYDVTRACEAIDNDPTLLEDASGLTRDSDLVHWPRFSFSAVAVSIASKYLYSTTHMAGVSLDKTELESLHGIDIYFANSLSGFSDYVRRSVVDGEGQNNALQPVLKDEVIARFMTCFAHGSQIHQNNIFLHRIGLPIIKLDGVFRGAFTVRDIERIAVDMDEAQRSDFRRIMYSRPYGGNVLFGWKRAAFFRGLI